MLHFNLNLAALDRSAEKSQSRVHSRKRPCHSNVMASQIRVAALVTDNAVSIGACHMRPTTPAPGQTETSPTPVPAALPARGTLQLLAVSTSGCGGNR
jgi:hypothetical protein